MLLRWLVSRLVDLSDQSLSDGWVLPSFPTTCLSDNIALRRTLKKVSRLLQCDGSQILLGLKEHFRYEIDIERE